MSVNIHLIKEDITTMTVDAVVNAANTSLLGGGGVDGAIHAAGGPQILEQCKEIRQKQGGCKVGEAVLTTGGKLKANYVIHTVGPQWNGGDHDEIHDLMNCYINSLKLADENNFKTIAFPNISTGIYRFPKDLAAETAIDTVRNVKCDYVKDVYFVCFDDENYELYTRKLQELNK